jgi:hypothetical protein
MRNLSAFMSLKTSVKCVTVKNGDDSSQLFMGSVKVTMSIGWNFKSVVTVQIINLDSFDFVIGLDMIVPKSPLSEGSQPNLPTKSDLLPKVDVSTQSNKV